MKPELQNKLYEKYPQIFCQKDLSMQETCMCWGIDVEEGWYNILNTLCSIIQQHIDYINGLDENSRKMRTGNKEQIFQVEASQVKEKFGGLRFYYDGGDNYIEGAVRMAENMSYVTCELCGAPGKPNESGWIQTFCDPCRNKEWERRQSLIKKS